MSHPRLALGVLVLLCHVAPALAAAPPPPEKQRITAASGVRVRAKPSPGAAEVAKLFIGTVLRELERSARQEQVGGKKDFWYRVATPEGQEGWVFGSFVLPFEPERRVQTWLEISRLRLADEKAPFVDRADLANFLKAAVAQAPDKASEGQLELARWRAVRHALEAYEPEVKTAFTKWVERQGEALVYSEPAGTWFVDIDVLWKLEEKYRGQPEAEALAWEAAKTPLPGECEGYMPCYLEMSRATEGEYLLRYPAGPHVGEALAALEQVLGMDAIAELDAEGRTDLRRQVGELEAALTKVNPAAKKKVAEQLKAIQKAASR